MRASDGEIGHVKDFYFDDKSWTLRYRLFLRAHVFAHANSSVMKRKSRDSLWQNCGNKPNWLMIKNIISHVLHQMLWLYTAERVHLPSPPKFSGSPRASRARVIRREFRHSADSRS